MKIGVMSGVAACASVAVATGASGMMTGFSMGMTNVTNSGQNLVRIEVFATFNGATDTVLNVFNFQAFGGWAAHADAATGFWHKDNFDTSGSAGTLTQEFGSWAPQLTGSATMNRPFDSCLLLGGNPVAANTPTGDPSWNGGGGNPDGWNRAQLPLYNDLGWFNSSPPNLQGRVGTPPNTATQVKVAQFVLSANDSAYRCYQLTVGYNNGAGGGVQFYTGMMTCPAPSAIALLGLAGLTRRRQR